MTCYFNFFIFDFKSLIESYLFKKNVFSDFVNKNNRCCGSEFNNRMAVVEKCDVAMRLRLFAPQTNLFNHECKFRLI